MTSQNYFNYRPQNDFILNSYQRGHDQIGMVNSGDPFNPYNDTRKDTFENKRKITKTEAKHRWTELQIKGPVSTLSAALFRLTHLTSLVLEGNFLLNLPPDISQLISLQHLDLSNNQLTELPPELGDITQLRELFLKNNQLQVIPYELGKLYKLQTFMISGNPLPHDILKMVNEVNGVTTLLTFLLDNFPHAHKPPDREWLKNTRYIDINSVIFTVMCYNILCDKYATRTQYGYCPTWALKWDYRSNNILIEMEEFKADIYCLQEVETEQFHRFFLPKLKDLGYDGIFTPKSRAKTMQEHERKFVDGCAIFYRISKFTLVEKFVVEFNQLAIAYSEGSDDMLNRVMLKDNVGLVALLQLTSSTNNTTTTTTTNNTNSSNNNNNNNNNKMPYLMVANVHMHWDPEYSDVKLIQTVLFMNELNSIVNNLEERNIGYNISNTHPPTILCGDFNSLPDSSVLQYLLTGSISADHPEIKDFGYEGFIANYCGKLRNGHKTNSTNNKISHSFSLNSIYDSNFPFTNYTYDFRGVIDYIFYSRETLIPIGLLGPLDEMWIQETKMIGCPNAHIPSDHIPLMAQFELPIS